MRLSYTVQFALMVTTAMQFFALPSPAAILKSFDKKKVTSKGAKLPKLKCSTFLVVCAAAVSLCGPAMAVSLVTNGGFETADFTGWVLSGNIAFANVNGDLPHSGTNAAEFGASGSDTVLTQTLGTMTGAEYSVTFWLQNSGGVPNNFSASFGGSSLLSLPDAPASLYTQYAFDVFATGALTDLVFHFRSDPNFLHFDDVSVNQIGGGDTTPLPAALPLFATGLGALGLLGWRRKKKAAALAA